MHTKTKKINIQMRKELTLEFTTPAYRSIILDKLLLIPLISLVQCTLIKLLTAASVNPSCSEESISHPHLIWATVEMLNIMYGQHISSVNYFWKNCLVWFHFARCGTQQLILQQCCCWCCSKHCVLLVHSWAILEKGSCLGCEELHFNLRELSKSNKSFLRYPLQNLNRHYSEFKLSACETAWIGLALQSSVYFRFVHK